MVRRLFLLAALAWVVGAFFLWPASTALLTLLWAEPTGILAVVWLILNVGLMIGWTASHNWSPRTPMLCLVGLPFLIAGLTVGEYLHHKLDGPAFRAFVNVVLIINGLLLILFAR